MTSDSADIRRDTLFSLLPGNPPVGVDPIFPPSQTVRTYGSIKEWTLRKVGKNRYRLSIGGYPYIGVEERWKDVTASLRREEDKEWTFTYVEHQNGFLIALADFPIVGWQVTHSDEIVTSPLIPDGSNPPNYPAKHLFRWKSLGRADLE